MEEYKNPFEFNILDFQKIAKIEGSDLRSEAVDEIIFKSNEAFELFCSLYDTNYGSININDNLIDIHTGGWSDNEYLISQFKETYWWKSNLKISAVGGHYYFNTDIYADDGWKIIATK